MKNEKIIELKQDADGVFRPSGVARIVRKEKKQSKTRTNNVRVVRPKVIIRNVQTPQQELVDGFKTGLSILKKMGLL